MQRTLIVFSVLVAAAGWARAQVGDPRAGREIALTVCGDCHQVEPRPTTPSPNPDAPRFADVARMPSTTETSIKVFLRSTHATMPNFQFRQDELNSIIAYILDMKAP
jgi:mono/diheme cytochrome c family protein